MQGRETSTHEHRVVDKYCRFVWQTYIIKEFCRQGYKFCMSPSCMTHNAHRLFQEKNFKNGTGSLLERRKHREELSGQISPAAVRWALRCCWHPQQSLLSYPTPPPILLPTLQPLAPHYPCVLPCDTGELWARMVPATLKRLVTQALSGTMSLEASDRGPQ